MARTLVRNGSTPNIWFLPPAYLYDMPLKRRPTGIAAFPALPRRAPLWTVSLRAAIFFATITASIC